MLTLARNEDAQAVITVRLRAPQAAQYVGLANATLAKFRCLGGGPVFTKLGRTVVYTRADLDEWLRNGCKTVRTVAAAGRAGR